MMTIEERYQKLGKRIEKVYKQANEELTVKVDSFFAKFKEQDERKRKLVQAGTLKKSEYTKWRKNKLLAGQTYVDLRDNMAVSMMNADKIAAAYINRELVPLYVQNYNAVGRRAERLINGYSFDVIDQNTVRNLATKNSTLLPYKYVDGKRMVRWNTKRVNSAMLQGILQGDSIDKIAERLRKVTKMNEESALRNARTAFTGAQNRGRLDGMKKLDSDGTVVEKEWLATSDGRTREAHAELDGVRIPWDEPFNNEFGDIDYPGDPGADAANVYNCRCTLLTHIVGFKRSDGSIVYVEDEETDEL